MIIVIIIIIIIKPIIFLKTPLELLPFSHATQLQSLNLLKTTVADSVFV